MWTRALLKMNARANLRKNYVNVVIVSLITAFLTGDLGNSSLGSRITVSYPSGNVAREIYTFTTAMTGLLIVVAVLGLIFTILFINPIIVGANKFFIENHYTNPKLNTILHAFKTNYLNIIKTMFLMKVYIFLWSLLLVIPGIIKSYSYRLVPYILADNPDIDADYAITLSREMMDGQKFDVFILDFSFFLWAFLSALTFNVVGIFYVFPYINATSAELYLAIKNGSVDNDDSHTYNDWKNNSGDYYG